MENNSQFEVADSLMQANTPRGKENTWTDIGEVEVVFSVFGKAMVLTLAEKQKMYRSRLLMMLFLVAMAASAWQWGGAYLPDAKSPVIDMIPEFGLRQQNIELNLPPENVATAALPLVAKKAHKPRVKKPVISKPISPKPVIRSSAVKKVPARTSPSVAAKLVVKKTVVTQPVPSQAALVPVPPSKPTSPVNTPAVLKQTPNKALAIKPSSATP